MTTENTDLNATENNLTFMVHRRSSTSRVMYLPKSLEKGYYRVEIKRISD